MVPIRIRILFCSLLFAHLPLWGQVHKPLVPAVSVPFEVYMDYIFVKAKANGKQVTLLFDTGSRDSYLFEEAAKATGLKLRSRPRFTPVRDSLLHSRLRSLTLEIGSLNLELGKLNVYRTGEFSRYTGRSIDGVLGMDICRQYVVEIDFDNMRLKLYDPATFIPPDGYREAEARYRKGIPQFPVLLHGDLQAWCEVRTGFPVALGISLKYAERKGLFEQVPDYLYYFQPVLPGHLVPVRLAHQPAIGYQGYRVLRVPLALERRERSLMDKGHRAPGVVGYPMVQRYNTIFQIGPFYNPMASAVYIKPRETERDPFREVRAGLILKLDSTMQHVLVERVFAGSPSELAGIQPGDELVAIYDIPVLGLTMEQIYGYLDHSDRALTLYHKRDKTTYKKTFRVQPLLP